MPLFEDQLGRNVFVKPYPQSIISLVPSQTELLHYFSLDKEVKGITKFCVHPQHWFNSKTRVGGTKQLHLARIRSLNPDLILANKEENIKEQIEELAKDYPVWVSDVNDLTSALEMIKAVGSICGKEKEATNLTQTISELFKRLQLSNNSNLRTAYLIWRNPYMTVGGDSFISKMLDYAGFDNIFKNQLRYPVITIPQLQTVNCQLLLLSSEPYPFAQKHIKELQAYLPQTRILLVDGELFSWYGSRLLQAPAYFHKLHQKLIPATGNRSIR